MFRSMALGMVSAVALTASASAADVYGGPGGFKDGPYGPPEPWTGLYIGAHVGVADGNASVKDVDQFATTGTKSFTTSGDIFGGATAGFNVQRGSLVFGVEGDAGYMGLSGSQVVGTNPNNLTGGTVTHSIDPGVYADLTGRLGFASGRWLLYGKAGLAFYDGEGEANGLAGAGQANLLYPAGSNDYFWKVSKGSYLGWTAGGGIEYAFSPLVSFKVEYLHFDFGSDDSTLWQYRYTWANTAAAGKAPVYAITSTTTASYRYEHALDADSVKFGINFHVQPPEPPLSLK